MAKKTFKQVQSEVMEMARKTGMDEMDAIATLRRRLKREGIALPSSMATDAEYNKQLMDKGDKPKMNKGGYANCGASSPATQKSTQMLNKGGLLKPDNPGLKKLPTSVRNKMGYMNKGGYAKKK